MLDKKDERTSLKKWAVLKERIRHYSFRGNCCVGLCDQPGSSCPGILGGTLIALLLGCY